MTSIFPSRIVIAIFLINIVLCCLFIFTQHYQPLFIVLHIFSILLLWVIAVFIPFLRKKRFFTKKEFFILAGFFILAIIVGTYKLAEITPGMYGDEIAVGVESLKLIQQNQLPPFFGSYFHPTPLLYVTAMSIQMFGHTMIAIRLPNIILGGLTVISFYILLRIFFPLRFAFLGTILLLFQYTHIIITRLAYESSASLLLQILVFIFFVRYQKTNEKAFLIGLGLLLGAGLYTYLNFQVFAVTIFIATIFLLFCINCKEKNSNLFSFCLPICVVAMPLFSYAIIDPHGFFGRVGEISLFSRGYSMEQLLSELWGNIFRSVLLPFVGIPGSNPPFIGDPNPGKNPAGVMMFDPLTTILAIIGFVFLLKRKRQIFWFCMLLLLPPYASDILSSEVIPGLHYFGLGHPNALRLSGMIPIILFTATSGLQTIYKFVMDRFTKNALPIVCGLVFLICLINWHWYFDQQNINRKFYLYNYKVNHADILQMISFLNAASINTVHFTNSLGKNTNYIAFFLKPSIKTEYFMPTSVENTVHVIKSGDATAIEVDTSTVSLINALLNDWELQTSGYEMHEIRGIVDQPDIVIFEKDGT